MFSRRLLAIGLSVSASLVLAAPVPKKLRAYQPSKVDTAQIKVFFSEAPLSEVLGQFSDATSLRLEGDVPPCSLITLKPNKMYSTGEYLSLLNERLELDQLRLIRFRHTIYVQPADQKIDLYKVDRIDTAESLKKRGKREFVRMAIELTDGLLAKEVFPIVKALVSPNGMASITKDGKIDVFDQAMNVRAVHSFLNGKPDKCPPDNGPAVPPPPAIQWGPLFEHQWGNR
jgi:hypothetical protein